MGGLCNSSVKEPTEKSAASIPTRPCELLSRELRALGDTVGGAAEAMGDKDFVNIDDLNGPPSQHGPSSRRHAV